MNLLVIGNGFDLAHGRPTKYRDFLEFAKYIMIAKDYNEDKKQFQEQQKENLSKMHSEVRDYILRTFDGRIVSNLIPTQNRNKKIQEIYDCLDKNIWYKYFASIHKDNKIHGGDWIDFEKEIFDIISFFDYALEGLFDYLPPYVDSSTDESQKAEKFWGEFCCLYPDLINQRNEFEKITCLDFIKKTYSDLEKLIRCLEIYLDDCVNRIEIKKFSPDIKGLNLDFVLSFNYTAIPKEICYLFPPSEKIHHIHGQADVQRSASENNMVLGVNEYWEGSKKDSNTDFNSYKKFVQRIIKETGLGYKWFLKNILDKYNKKCGRISSGSQKVPPEHNAYIFGHSLNITDGDVLKEIILNPDIRTVIFYRNKQQQADQIANLSRVLGQEKLLELTFNVPPTLVFKQQADMVDYPSNE